MKEEYDLKNRKRRKNPYFKKLTEKKQSITIRLDASSIDYFKSLSEELDIPYQRIINLYLRDCASTKRKLKVLWTDK